jgi:hypothetical protein
MILGQNKKMFSFDSLEDLRADPFPFMIACSRGAGVGVDGVETAAACLLVLTLDMFPYRSVCRNPLLVSRGRSFLQCGGLKEYLGEEDDS